ncbi:MAG: hypothetical protein OHK0026_11580 [Rhodocyclaceae bacterium]
MKKKLRLYLDRFDAMSLRERILVYAAAGLVAVYLGDALFISPLARQTAAYDSQIAAQRSESQGLRGQIDALRADARQDPDAAAKARIRAIEARLGTLDASLQGAQKKLVAPERMASLIQDLLRRNPRIELAGLRTLPRMPLVSGEAGAAEPANPAADKPARAGALQAGFRHGIEITLRGSYLDLLAWLTQLEALPWKVYWDSLAIQVEEHPRARLVLVLYTLSLDETWLKL